MKHISVVVPFHGAEPHLARCLDSLFVQRYPTWKREILFVDGGGSAEARAVIERQLAFRLIDGSESGPYAARNAGVAAARGEIIAFTNADCALAPDWLESVDAALSDPGVQVAVGSYLPARESFAATALARYQNEKNRYIFDSADDRLYCGSTNNMAVRASLFHEIGTFPLRQRAADAVFLRQVVARFGREAVRYVPSMAVRQLDVRGALDYCRKAFGLSRGIRELESVNGLRQLDLRERMDAYSRTVKGAGYNPFGAGALLGVLGLGVLSRKAGRLASGSPASPANGRSGRSPGPASSGAVRANGGSAGRDADGAGWREAV